MIIRYCCCEKCWVITHGNGMCDVWIIVVRGKVNLAVGTLCSSLEVLVQDGSSHQLVIGAP